MAIESTKTQAGQWRIDPSEAPTFRYSDLPEQIQVGITKYLSPRDTVSLKLTSKEQNRLIEQDPCLQAMLLGSCQGPLPEFPHAALQRLVVPRRGSQTAKERIEQVLQHHEKLAAQNSFDDNNFFKIAMARWTDEEVGAGTSPGDAQRVVDKICSTRKDLSDELDLSNLHFRSLPPLSGLKLLKRLYLENCAELISLPERIGDLEQLEVLDLSGCAKLRSLPSRIGDLLALRALHLTDCRGLITLPERIGDLAALVELNLESCSQLPLLPNCIGDLTALKGLSLTGCANLKALPNRIGDLTALRTLSLNNCTNLASLPESTRDLAALAEIDLRGCTLLDPLPESLLRPGVLLRQGSMTLML